MIYVATLINYVKYGHLGLFIYTLVETLAPLPPIEILQIPMTLLNPSSWYLYVINICLSSLIGIVVGYELGLKFGYKLLRFIGVKEKNIEKARDWLNKYDILAISFFAFTPFPFTVGIIVCGIMKLNRWKYYVTCTIARFARFIMVGYICYKMSFKVNVSSISTSKISLYLMLLGFTFVVGYYLVLAIKNRISNVKS